MVCSPARAVAWSWPCWPGLAIARSPPAPAASRAACPEDVLRHPAAEESMTGTALPVDERRTIPVWGVVSLLAALLFWTARLAADPGRGCFLDLVNLAFHEAGHLFLSPFGSTVHYLGGTLGQLAVPTALALYFLLAQPARPLGAAFCAWWAGGNLVNVSVYMADARDLALPLVCGADPERAEAFYR